MASRVEDYLQKAEECEAKAQAADQNDIADSFRRLAEYWRLLARSLAIKPDRIRS